MSSKRRDVVALDDDGKREYLERDVACRKREVGPLSLLLIVRGIPADPNLFPINATTYRHLASSQGWVSPSRSLTFSDTYPPVIQVRAILARGGVSSSSNGADMGIWQEV